MELKKYYDKNFKPSEEYLKNLPDMANGEIIGANTPIQKVILNLQSLKSHVHGKQCIFHRPADFSGE